MILTASGGNVVEFDDIDMSFAAVAAIPGDFDLDNDVDGFDFLEWQRGQSPDPLSATDLADWEANYGTVAPLSATATAVPEPTSLLLVVAPVGIYLQSRKQRESR